MNRLEKKISQLIYDNMDASERGITATLMAEKIMTLIKKEANSSVYSSDSKKISARNTDPSTSKDAARNITPHINRLENLVVAEITNSKDGLKTIEIAEKTDLDRVTISPRIKPLCIKGILRDSGKKTW